MKNSFKVILRGIWICAFSLSFLFSSGNNIRINGIVQVSQGTGDTLVLSFPLRWDNSWRDQFNWDAAWIFLKYKSGTGGWNHVNLCSGGHRFVNGSGQPVPFGCMPGNTGSSTVGLFVYRNTLEAGNTPEIMCQVKCLKSSVGNLTSEQFASHEGFILAQAVEMVYVPYGGYYLGDGECANRFSGGRDGSPALIDSEDAITASTATKIYPVTNNINGTAQSIAAVYPKGYKGFYMMKYEVSQEQWVYFLNNLTDAQQQERVPGLAGLKSREFIFGSKSAPSNRNGIIVAEPSYNGSPVIFANNLNNNEIYSEDGDGKTIACNYLSPSDMLAYCSWIGLRPMSELEYEKACRQSYPEQPVRGEYAWHNNGITGHLNAVSNGGQRNERSGTTNANVNAGNNFGPVRCGLFATGSSTQQSAGAAFWGGMELSGNLKELCYNIAYTGFNSSTMGAGVYNTALWSVTPAHFGIRGGGFASPDDLLRVSDRTEAAGYFADINKRDSTVGFRAVRTIGSEVTITQGNLIAKAGGINVTTICPGTTVDITTDAPAKVMSGGNMIPNMNFTYVWYNGANNIIPGETGEVLNYSDFVISGTSATVSYSFKRKAVCTVGETISVLTLTLPNVSVTLTPATVGIDACNNSTTVTASAYCNNPVFTWKYGNKVLNTGATYTPSRGNFDGTGNLTVDVTVSSGGCTSEKQGLKVNLPAIQEIASNLVTMANCGNAMAIDSRDGKRYCTVKIGTQCWMGKNLDVGSYQATTGDYWKFDEAGIQKWCYGNVEANCTAYGGLYEWWEAVCGGKCNSSVTTGNAESLNLNSESQLVAYGAKMVPGSTTQVQGICPDGWRMPSDGDWIIFEKYMGISNAGTITAWLGTDQGSRMKKPGIFEGYNWCSNATCNSSGLGMLPGGQRLRKTNNFRFGGSDGFWWTSTPSNNYAAWYRALYYNLTTVARYNEGRNFGFSVRCVRN